jgi:hypothetical protein
MLPRVSPWAIECNHVVVGNAEPKIYSMSFMENEKYRTVVRSSFEEYLKFCIEYDNADDAFLADERQSRNEKVLRFPYAVMLQVSFPELDFTNRWCWQSFGPFKGECHKGRIEYPVCHRDEPHCHLGKWLSHFYVKTEYDFGFNEWFFLEMADCDLFIANIDSIHWGENFTG